MARWVPQDNVGLTEQVGRRLFDDLVLKGAGSQPSFSGMSLVHFHETRGDVSLDRLGASGTDRKVVNYLTPRAAAAGQKFGKPKGFNGWAVVQAKELIRARQEPKLPIVASPVNEPEPNDNIYHAHIVSPEELTPYLLALHLRHIFTSCGAVEHNKIRQTWRDRLRVHPLTSWISAKLRIGRRSTRA